ncbi:MAG: MFS transporter [Spirulinaceae cyanobacterium RM2_2_10]|nr:MFS transporter [Spirulinaceae cyanobacterium RM2_2_10]
MLTKTDVTLWLGPMENAFVFAFIGVMAVIMQGFLIRKLVPAFGEARLAVSGLMLMTIGFALTAFVPQAGLLYLAMGVLATGSGMANHAFIRSAHTWNQLQVGSVFAEKGDRRIAIAVLREQSFVVGWLNRHSFDLNSSPIAEHDRKRRKPFSPVRRRP